MNKEGIYQCNGSIQGGYLVFIPNKSMLAEKLIEEAHLQNTHVGGSGLKIAKIRSE